jgi:hypothetical protein
MSKLFAIVLLGSMLVPGKVYKFYWQPSPDGEQEYMRVNTINQEPDRVCAVVSAGATGGYEVIFPSSGGARKDAKPANVETLHEAQTIAETFCK